MDAEEIRATCPPALGPLLERLLALRAFKTACMLGYWESGGAPASCAAGSPASRARSALSFCVARLRDATRDDAACAAARAFRRG